MADYDVIIVGGGNGGLSAAAYLAKAGKRVLLLEKHNLPGGCATTFRRGRFEFEASLHEFCAMGDGEHRGGVRKTLESYGIDIPGVFSKEAYRTICTDPEHPVDATMPVGIDAYIDAMEKAVPGSRKGISEIMEVSRMISDAVGWLGKRDNKPKLVEYPKLIRSYGDLLRLEPLSLDDVCRRFGLSDEARMIYESYWQYISASPQEMSFAVYAMMTYTYLNETPWFPKDKSHALSLAFDRAIRDLGGEIRYNTEVKEITIKDGSVKGVVLADGTVIECPYVVSNLMPTTVFGKMVDPKEVPVREKKLNNARRIGQACATVYLGLDCTAEELGLTDYSYFITDKLDGHEAYLDQNGHEARELYSVTVLNNLLPDASPDGTCMLYFTILYTDDPFKDMKEEEYFDKKDAVAREIVEHFEKVMHVNIQDHIEEIVTALPVTFARYLGTPRGAIYGYVPRTWDGMFAREQSTRVHDHTIRGLRFVGGHSTQMDGYSQSIGTGPEQGKILLKEMGAHENG